MYISIQPFRRLFANKFLMFTIALAFAVIAPQIGGIKRAFADDGGYPWANASAVNVGTYDWGYYPTCPTNDSGCMSLTGTLSGHTYGEADPWVYNLRNCTSYVAWKTDSQFNVSVSSWGNATTWDTYAAAAGYTVYSGSSHTPVVGEIAQWDNAAGGLGHVAYVTAVSGTTATIAEYNSGLPRDASNNLQWGMFYNGRTTASNSAGTPDHWIHIGTVQTPATAMPVSSQITTGAVQHVFTGTSAGNVIDTSWTGSGSPTSWIVGSALGEPVTSLSSQFVGGVLHVYASTSAGSIVDIYWGGGQTIGQRQVASYSAGNYYLTSLVDSSGYQHVDVGTPAGNVYDLYWQGIGTVGSQTVGSSLGAPISSVSMQYPSGVVHVYAATTAGSTVDVYWGGGQSPGQRQVWYRSDTTGNGLSSQVDSSGVQHAYTGITAGSIYDSSWTGVGSVTTLQVR